MTTELELWRAGSLVAVTSAVSVLESAGRLGSEVRADAQVARLEMTRQGDERLLVYLRRYCPSDPHIASYPGPR